MPTFQEGKDGGRLLEQHRKIHEGMDELERYVRGCQGGERESMLEDLKGVWDGFRGVLWQHLDE